MALKKFNPTTPSLRQKVVVDRSDVWKGRPLKKLVSGKKRGSGRNNRGVITVRHQGGGAKKLFRQIDFKRQKSDMEAKVLRIEYDPNRTALIALIEYTDGEKSYIIAADKMKAGDMVVSGDKVDIKNGNALPLKNIPIGTILHNIEMKPGKGAQIARSAGSFVQLAARDSNYAQIKLRSGEVRMVPVACMASIGSVSNQDHRNRVLGKAGASRWRGVRPTVRGAAMNPVDHPHGGGEGKTSGGRHPVSPTGLSAKGKKTRNRKNPSSKWIVRSRHRRK